MSQKVDQVGLTRQLADVTVLIAVPHDQEEELWKDTLSSLPKDRDLNVKAVRYKNRAEDLNNVVRKLDTTFIFIMEAGDLIQDNALQMLVSCCWDASCTYPSYHLLHPSGQSSLHPTIPASDFCPSRIQKDSFIHRSALIRRNDFLLMGGYRDLPAYDHWDLYVRMSRAGMTFKGIPESMILSYIRASAAPSACPPEQARSIYDSIVKDRPEPIVTFHYQASFPTTYYRCLLPAKYLPGVCRDIETFPIDIMNNEEDGSPTVFDFPEQEGASIFQFPGDRTRYAIIERMNAKGIPTLVEIDDNYTVQTPHRHKGWVRKINDPRSAHSLQGHAYIVEASDVVICSTKYLANIYRKRFNKPTFVCPNQVEPDDYERERLAALAELPPREEGKIRLGWFASSSHITDIPIVKRALEWASKQDNIEVWTMGLDTGWTTIRRIHVPWTNDLGTYHALCSILDIGLAPVSGNPWALCRSDLKALDYGVYGIPAIVQNASPYDLWTHEENCIKASSPKEFLYYLQTLVRDESARKNISDAARRYIFKERTIAGNVWRWRDALESAMEAKKSKMVSNT